MFAYVAKDRFAVFVSKRITLMCSAVFISLKENMNSD